MNLVITTLLTASFPASIWYTFQKSTESLRIPILVESSFTTEVCIKVAVRREACVLL